VKSLVAALIAVGCLYLSIPLSAHHGSAVYDLGKRVTVKGTVTAWLWANPHCFLKVDTKDESGNVAHWVIENQSPLNIYNYGWSKSTFKSGDEVVVDVEPYKNQSDINPVGRFSGQVIINGEVFKTAASSGR